MHAGVAIQLFALSLAVFGIGTTEFAIMGLLPEIAADLGVTEKTLLLSLEAEGNLDLAARNNPRLKVVRALGVSIVDLLDHDMVVVSEPALKRLSEVLSS
jgi:ribosomal protein L4